MGAILRHQRIIDNYEIKLFQRRNDVEFIIHDLKSGDSNREKLPIPEQLLDYDIDTKIYYFINAEFIVDRLNPLVAIRCQE